MSTPSRPNIATTSPTFRPVVRKLEPPALGSLKPGGTTAAAMVVVVDEVDVVLDEVVDVDRCVDEGARWLVVVWGTVVVGAMVDVVEVEVDVVDVEVVVVDVVELVV